MEFLPRTLVLCTRNKFKKSAERLKDFYSLSDYFGDACIAALNQKNSTSARLRRALGLRQLLLFYALLQQASFSQNTRMSLAKAFQPHWF
jgi:hypothetical protein